MGVIRPMEVEKAHTLRSLRRIIRELEQVAKEVAGSDAEGPESIDTAAAVSSITSILSNRSRLASQISDEELARYASQVYTTRRKRDRRIGERFFGEPSWDILLDLFIQRQRGAAVSVTSACLASASPATTGHRWLGLLEDAGIVARYPDPHDGRVSLVRLTDQGWEIMRNVLAEHMEVTRPNEGLRGQLGSLAS